MEVFGVDNVTIGVQFFVVLVQVKCNRGVEGGLGVAPCTRNRLLTVAADLGGPMTESRERVGWAARRVETSSVVTRDGLTEQLLPPCAPVVTVGFRLRRLDTKRLESGIDPSLVLVDLLASKTEEDEEEVTDERMSPYDNEKLVVVSCV